MIHLKAVGHGFSRCSGGHGLHSLSHSRGILTVFNNDLVARTVHLDLTKLSPGTGQIRS